MIYVYIEMCTFQSPPLTLKAFGSRGLYHVTREANNPDVFSGFAIGMDGSVCMDGKVNVV